MKDPRYLKYRAALEKSSAGLASVNGYDKIISRIKGVTDWEEYTAISAQINVTLWFKNKNILKKIEPELPHREGYADILLSFPNQDIYCEITSFQSIIKSIESKEDIEEIKIQNKLRKIRKGQPWLTNQGIDNEIKIDKIVRNLLEKTNRQLPLNQPGILALETGKAAVFHHTIKEVAAKLFKKRPQVILIMLWSLEKGSRIGKAPFWFVNPNSPHQNIRKELLKYLGQENKVMS